MEKVLRCDCGYEVPADNGEELVDGIKQHALDVHGMDLRTEDALLVASRVQLDDLSPRKEEHDQNSHHLGASDTGDCGVGGASRAAAQILGANRPPNRSRDPDA
jgi:predicted small metal-binding protein